MLVVDVETSGTDPRYHSLVSIGAIDMENPSDTFYKECQIFTNAKVEDEALAVNGMTLEEITDTTKPTEAEIIYEYIAWAKDKIDHTIGGQNPSFDVSFLMAAAERCGADISIPKRVVDLHSIVYFHMSKRGFAVPHKNHRTDLDSDKIMEYVGIHPEPKPHIAINGAKWEAEAFNRLFKDEYLFPEFKDFNIPWK